MVSSSTHSPRARTRRSVAPTATVTPGAWSSGRVRRVVPSWTRTKRCAGRAAGAGR
ncbi:MAG: hypothetical protein IPF99_26975 [Deltaproteobacteria bacterium]|nr:hypothetical protein [Deltaproteobacteria bacterium]